MPLGVIDILKLSGVLVTPHSRFVRHQDDRYPVAELRRNNWLEVYQGYQRRPVFHRTDQLISFYGLAGTRAAFFGVYTVLGHRTAREGPALNDCSWCDDWRRSSHYFYDLRLDRRSSELRDRLIVDWGPGTRSWVQKSANKAVLEIQEPGRRLPPFDDYLEFSLSYAQLQDLFANEEAHREWRARLSAIAGVYLILAETSGDLYVGSASGEGGIWARWRQYAKSGHAGNALLRKLITPRSSYPQRFRFSVLQILPKTMSRDEVLRRETIYKAKLGTRAKGLNLN